MKQFLVFVILILLGHCAFGQAPMSMSYQAVIRDNLNILVTNQVVGVRIEILQGSAEGFQVYAETLTSETNSNGLLSLEFGSDEGFELVDWSNGPYFLKTEFDISGGENYSITAVSQLLSVPYSIYAGFAGKVDYVNVENMPLIPNDISELSDENGILFGGEWTDLLGVIPEISMFDNDAGYLQSYTETQTLLDVLNESPNAGEQRISNLSNPILPQDAATKSYVDLLENRINEMEIAMLESGMLKMTDYDGNEYDVVMICNQLWMKENLKTCHYNDGTLISKISVVSQWATTLNGAYCWYENDSVANNLNYGKLYNFESVNSGKLCPQGWHVPTLNEWNVLFNCLGGPAVAGGKMKLTMLWAAPNTGATNSSGFDGLPGGIRESDGNFYSDMYYLGAWWSSTEDTGDNAKAELVILLNNAQNANWLDYFKRAGGSIRCVHD